ncbi:MAG: outer membrane lipoprotein carrier protein LolA [Methylophilaceae bacterium]|jgi:outer membrane lipoprotein carrier protein|nr:outer membrane lipoprotein carrier protein LolA [Methylophilaceae bacterium]NCA26582.1 outer membrane lipoprotein carrier protein LolA [Methylophilaceae bacterium]
MKKTALTLVFSLLAFAHQAANASGLERMKEYFQNIQSAQASFHQTVTDKQGQKTQDVTGTMQLQKPNKFRWDYHKPYVQQIVGDGEKIWIFDPELNQVTVRSFSKAASSSPAALLAGGKDIERSFTIKDTSRKGDLEWVMAVPKVRETGFERLFLGFKGDALMEMELHDSFGNRTAIEFTDVQRNPKLPADTFKFVPPRDADVLRD